MARFLPGISGNPGGRPREQGKAAQLAREHCAHAVFALARIACDLSATHRLQLDAARELIRLGFGRDPRGKQESGSTGDGIGRFPRLRTDIEDALRAIDHQATKDRRILLLELADLERDEGLTVAPPPGRDR